MGTPQFLSELGTLEEFKHLLTTAKAYEIEIAMDIAFQCSPDHPWVSQTIRIGLSRGCGRDDSVRGEPSEEISGYLSARF